MKPPTLTPTDRLEPKGSSTVPKHPSPETFDPDEIENRAIIKALKELKAERDAKLGK
jgi:hypothetical protein